jgi:sec-independent protein translocase protein TatB
MIGFNHAPEIIVLLIIAFLVFGPEKLPDMARGAGKALREFRRVSDELQQSVSTTFAEPLQQVQQVQQEVTQQMHDMSRIATDTLNQGWNTATNLKPNVTPPPPAPSVPYTPPASLPPLTEPPPPTSSSPTFDLNPAQHAAGGAQPATTETAGPATTPAEQPASSSMV